jgi:hypothetical protein
MVNVSRQSGNTILRMVFSRGSVLECISGLWSDLSVHRTGIVSCQGNLHLQSAVSDLCAGSVCTVICWYLPMFSKVVCSTQSCVTRLHKWTL